MYGHEFKILRQSQNITQKQASHGICSESKLSRWEHDQVEVEFSTAINLLNRIHITPSEFMNWSKFSPNPYYLDSELQETLDSDNLQLIKKVALKKIARYHQTKLPDDLYMTLPLCNQLLIETGKNYLSDADLLRLSSLLSKVTFWSEYYLSIFGNSIFLLKPRQVYGVAMLILKSVDHFRKEINDFEGMLGALGDATIKLVEAHDLSYAKKLLAALQQVEIPQYMSFFPMTYDFMSKVITFLENGNDQPILEMIDQLRKWHCQTAAQTFLEVYKDIQKYW